MRIYDFKDFADVTNNARTITPRYNRGVSISVDKKYLYINGNAMPNTVGEAGQVIMSQGIITKWVDAASIGAGSTGMQGPTGAFGGPPGETGLEGTPGVTGLANMIQQTSFTGMVNVPGIMWNFQDELFYGYVTGLNGNWVQMSAGAMSGDTGSQGATGLDGAYAGQGLTGIQGATGAQSNIEKLLYITSDLNISSAITLPELQFTGLELGDYIIDSYFAYTGIYGGVDHRVFSSGACVMSCPEGLNTGRINTTRVNAAILTTLGNGSIESYVKGIVTITTPDIGFKFHDRGNHNSFVLRGSFVKLIKVV